MHQKEKKPLENSPQFPEMHDLIKTLKVGIKSGYCY